MNETNGDPPFDAVVCGRCASIGDPEDNFCRHCGLALQEQRLPAVGRSRLPVLSVPALPSVVVKGAAVVAVGAIAEILMRRAAGRLLRSSRSAVGLPARAGKNGKALNGSLPDGTALESETFLLRRVRIKR